MKKNALHEAVLALGQDAEYMSDKMVAVFKQALDKEVPELQSRIQRLTEEYQAGNADKIIDPIDKAQQQNEQNDIIFEINKAKNRLKRIQIAYRNIETSDYGFCLTSGNEIGIPRMCVDPTNTLDTESATLSERQQRQHIKVA